MIYSFKNNKHLITEVQGFCVKVFIISKLWYVQAFSPVRQHSKQFTKNTSWIASLLKKLLLKSLPANRKQDKRLYTSKVKCYRSAVWQWSFTKLDLKLHALRTLSRTPDSEREQTRRQKGKQRAEERGRDKCELDHNTYMPSTVSGLKSKNTHT